MSSEFFVTKEAKIDTSALFVDARAKSIVAFSKKQSFFWAFKQVFLLLCQIRSFFFVTYKQIQINPKSPSDALLCWVGAACEAPWPRSDGYAHG